MNPTVMIANCLGSYYAELFIGKRRIARDVLGAEIRRTEDAFKNRAIRTISGTLEWLVTMCLAGPVSAGLGMTDTEDTGGFGVVWPATRLEPTPFLQISVRLLGPVVLLPTSLLVTVSADRYRESRYDGQLCSGAMR